MRSCENFVAQRGGNRSSVSGAVQPVDHRKEWGRRGTDVLHGGEPIEHRERPATELSGREEFGRQGCQEAIRRQHRRILKGAQTPLGIQQNEVVVRVEGVQQILQPQTAVGRMQQHIGELSRRVV